MGKNIPNPPYYFSIDGFIPLETSDGLRLQCNRCEKTFYFSPHALPSSISAELEKHRTYHAMISESVAPNAAIAV